MNIKIAIMMSVFQILYIRKFGRFILWTSSRKRENAQSTFKSIQKRRQKEKYNEKHNPKFLGLEYDDCMDDDVLTEKFKPFIGVIGAVCN